MRRAPRGVAGPFFPPSKGAASTWVVPKPRADAARLVVRCPAKIIRARYKHPGPCSKAQPEGGRLPMLFYLSGQRPAAQRPNRLRSGSVLGRPGATSSGSSGFPFPPQTEEAVALLDELHPDAGELAYLLGVSRMGGSVPDRGSPNSRKSAQWPFCHLQPLQNSQDYLDRPRFMRADTPT
jgi:hypothetical protein